MNTRKRDDPHDLRRFVNAQDGVYECALSELKAGRKQSHWMWFVFPQIDGLGRSPTARLYAIKSMDEARSYLRHPLLGARLRACAAALLNIEERSAVEILGHTDALKLRSSMTLFSSVAGPGSVFTQVLDRYYGGAQDARTLQLLGETTGS